MMQRLRRALRPSWRFIVRRAYRLFGINVMWPDEIAGMFLPYLKPRLTADWENALRGSASKSKAESADNA